MTLSDLIDKITARIKTVTPLEVTVGNLYAGPGVTLMLISAPADTIYYDRTEARTYGFTAHIKHANQQTAIDTAQKIGEALSRWDIPKGLGVDYHLLTIEHGGPFFIHREPTTNYYIYGVEINAQVQY